MNCIATNCSNHTVYDGDGKPVFYCEKHQFLNERYELVMKEDSSTKQYERVVNYHLEQFNS
jgi:hypothetical protein